MSSKEKEVEIFEEEDDDVEILKRRISSHRLYGLLLETHLDCLKVCSDELEDSDDGGSRDDMKQQQQLRYGELEEASLGVLGHYSESDLDHFMEAYCLALGKLKEAMQKPQQKSMAFITNMHRQLNDLTPPEPALHPPQSLNAA